MDKKYKLLPPMMPNYITIDMVRPPIKNPSDLQEKPKIPITDLTPEEANEYAKLMFDTFLDHWNKKQSQLVKNR